MQLQQWLRGDGSRPLPQPAPRRNDSDFIELGFQRLEDRLVLSASGTEQLLFSVGGAAGIALPGLGQVEGADVVSYDGSSFALLFDGSDVGLSGADVDAVAVVNDQQLLLSFAGNTLIANLGTVGPSDLVLFDALSLGEETAGTFSLLASGSALGLSQPLGNVDALDVLEDGSIVLSTAGDVFLPAGPNGESILISDEDLVRLTPGPAGDFVGGTWELLFDGSDAALAGFTEEIDAVSVNGLEIRFSTQGSFFIETQGLGGDSQDVLSFQVTQSGENTTGTYLGLEFDGSVATGLLSWNLDALDYFAWSAATDPPPTAESLSAEVNEDGSVLIQLLGDDGEPDADQTLTYVIVDGPDLGTISSFDPATGSLIYSPSPNGSGTDQLVYLVQKTDANGELLQSELATVQLTVLPVNDAPVVQFGPLQPTGFEDVPLVIQGIAVSDVEADIAQTPVRVSLHVDSGTLTVADGVSNVVVNGNGTAEITLVGTTTEINLLLAQGVTFQGETDFAGTGTLTVTVHDDVSPENGGVLSAVREISFGILSTRDQVNQLQDRIEELIESGSLRGGAIRKLFSSPHHQDPKPRDVQKAIDQIERAERLGRLDSETAEDLIEQLRTIKQGLSDEKPRGKGRPDFNEFIDELFSAFGKSFKKKFGSRPGK